MDGKVLGSIYTVVGSAVLVANAVVLVVIIKAKELRKVSLWLIANMAFWDLLQGLNVLVFAVPSAFLNRFAYPKDVMGFSACLSVFLVGITALNTIAVVADRFISVKFPVNYRKIATKPAFVITVVCMIIVAAVRMILIAFPDKDCYFAVEIYLVVSNYNTVQELVAGIGFTITAIITVIVLSCLVMYAMRKRKQRITSFNVKKVPRKMVKLAVMVLLSALIYCLSYAPMFITIIANFMLGKDMSVMLAKFANVSLMSNSIWNVIIYTINYSDFRESLIRIFCRSYYLDRKRRRQIVPFTTNVRFRATGINTTTV